MVEVVDRSRLELTRESAGTDPGAVKVVGDAVVASDPVALDRWLEIDAGMGGGGIDAEGEGVEKVSFMVGCFRVERG